MKQKRRHRPIEKKDAGNGIGKRLDRAKREGKLVGTKRCLIMAGESAELQNLIGQIG
ncbi:hypothetical protein RSSM_01987 [Rhodopirellula sallentina SM41]|uniref:Uncharacterized protein n=1 Tax=Rhodopirellula sallentina SM41 TaxID=1263870 RepID=M5U5F8_9BACT|nr:hypothetical protein RSSM_01987 [Rhodopirellula sallentina SM41]